MVQEKLSRLKKVELRSIWPHEALDFTKWLAETENIELLSDEIGIEINNVEIEANVGDFNVDILAENEKNEKIIIENQLEQTNHDHLGKLITYASGHGAKYIIWIVKSVREEHRQAIDWLNEHTDDEVNFFLLKIEVFKIGENSPKAPRFQIISRPNDWAKDIKKTSQTGEISQTKMMQRDFWMHLNEHFKNQGSKLHTDTPRFQHWTHIRIGSSDAHIALSIDTIKDQFGIEIHIKHSKELYQMLFENKDEIESELGEKLEWMELPDKKASRIKLILKGSLDKKEKWDDYAQWFMEKATKFKRVFSEQIKNNTQ